jgi:hypothetical protein
MKIDEILNYNKGQQLLQRIGDAFLPNGQLKFPLDSGRLVPDDGSMHDRTADEVPDDIMDVATVGQGPRSIRQTPSVGGVDPRERAREFRSSPTLSERGRAVLTALDRRSSSEV